MGSRQKNIEAYSAVFIADGHYIYSVGRKCLILFSSVLAARCEISDYISAIVLYMA